VTARDRPPAVALNAILAFIGRSGIARFQTELVRQLAGRVDLHILMHGRAIARLRRRGLPPALARAELHPYLAPGELLRNFGRLARGLARHPHLLDRTWEGTHAGLSTRLLEGACADRLEVDLFHGTANYVPDTGPAMKRVITVHDTVPRTNPELCGRGSVVSFLKPDELRPTDEVVVSCRSAREDFLASFDHPTDRLAVVPYGLDHALFRPPADGPDRGERDFVLTVGHIEPRKNLVRALAAFEAVARSHPDLRWRVVGPQSTGWQAFQAAVSASPVRGRVDVIHAASDGQLIESYQHARAFFFPTAFEGFGMPVLEAFACGTPVAASAVPAVAEVAAGAALTFDPTDTPGMADALERAAFDDAGRAARRQAGIERASKFTWQKMASGYLAVYARALGCDPGDLLLEGAPLPVNL
jgi:glycosyltransferase involved in cell wall biosynthesis